MDNKIDAPPHIGEINWDIEWNDPNYDTMSFKWDEFEQWFYEHFDDYDNGHKMVSYDTNMYFIIPTNKLCALLNDMVHCMDVDTMVTYFMVQHLLCNIKTQQITPYETKISFNNTTIQFE